MGAEPRRYDDLAEVPAADTADGSAPAPEQAPGDAAASPEDTATGEAPAAPDPGDTGDEAAAGGADTAEPAAALAEAERQRDEYLDHLRRERAEFENFRKRMSRERMDALDRGAEQVVAELVRVLDHFGFALEAAQSSSDEQLAKGVEMVHGELMGVLQNAGLEEVPGTGAAFDPHCHEAVGQVEAEESVKEAGEEPVVVEVLRAGYRFKGRVLRPAAVKVAH